MKEGEPSYTAKQVAASRAAHLRFDPAPHVLEDRFAELLLGSDAGALIDLYADGGLWILQENRIFLPLRARYAEDLVFESHRAGVRQLVVLGAGLDSFGLRRPAPLSDLRVIEVDHPATQRWKRQRLADLAIPVPDHLSFVECDFAATSLTSALHGTAFRAGDPAVVSWMGVVYYLDRSTVRQALAELAALLAPSSAVVLDFMLPLEVLPQRYREIHDAMSAHLGQAGEPQVNRYLPDEIRAEFIAAGFARVDLASSDEIHRRHLGPAAPKRSRAERFGIAVGWR
jgi:methyltransferase (TIGR00027 family)